MMDIYHYVLPKPTECTTPRVDLNINYGPGQYVAVVGWVV
jgi:hypothetical protein